MIVDVHAHYVPKNFSAFIGDRYASRTDLSHWLDQQGQRAHSGRPNLAEPPSVTAEKFYYDIACYARRLFGFGD